MNNFTKTCVVKEAAVKWWIHFSDDQNPINCGTFLEIRMRSILICKVQNGWHIYPIGATLHSNMLYWKIIKKLCLDNNAVDLGISKNRENTNDFNIWPTCDITPCASQNLTMTLLYLVDVWGRPQKRLSLSSFSTRTLWRSAAESMWPHVAGVALKVIIYHLVIMDVCLIPFNAFNCCLIAGILQSIAKSGNHWWT